MRSSKILVTMLLAMSLVTTTVTTSSPVLAKEKTKTSSSSSTKKKTKDRNDYQEIDFEKWQRNDKEIAYSEGIKVRGQVVQVIEDGNMAQLRVAVDGDYDKMVLAIISNYGTVILEDDQIMLYGDAMGRYTYEAVLGNSITLPFMYVDIYDINDDIIE